MILPTTSAFVAFGEFSGADDLSRNPSSPSSEATTPFVEHLAADAVVPARRRDVPAEFLGMTEHRQTVPDLALLLSIVHQTSLSRETPDVNNLRQF